MGEMIFLQPVFKEVLWGGNKLRTMFGYSIPSDHTGEGWMISAHPKGDCCITEGTYKGKTLSWLWENHRELFGGLAGDVFPLLVKIIDAKDHLSIQVHPDDAYALEHENGQNGKSEMWYVLDASKDAHLVYGLKHDCTEAEIRKAIADGTLLRYLQRVPIQKDDLFFIEAGIVHAIGAGALIAEIQENSNLTYRLYDYDRVGKDGKKRELHVDKAMQVANLKSSAQPRQPLRVLKYKQGVALEFLTRCKYFEVYRVLLNTERRQLVQYRADEVSFRVMLCIGGCGTIQFEGGSIPFFKGDCIFVPADSVTMTITGQAQFLFVRG